MKMGKRERRLRRKELEDPGSRLPAPPPPSRGAPHRDREVTAEERLAVTEALRDRQDKTTGFMAALTETGEEPGTRASSSEGAQQQGMRGTETPSN